MVGRQQGSTTFLLLLVLVALTKSLGLEMKRILVTGANKGIGKAICHKLLADHPDVHVLLGSRDKDRGLAAVQDLIQELDCEGRVELVEIDTSSDESVAIAAKAIQSSGNNALYGIVNNAGISRGSSLEEVVNVNYRGPKRVFHAFSPFLQRPGGRVVNIASAAGPNFVASLSESDPLFEKLKSPWTIAGGFDELDDIAASVKTSNHYGISKALLSAYTVLLARREPDLIVNAVTPGWILTDMTNGMGATNPPSKGAVPPVWLLMSQDLETVPTGRYYGSDCVRSPLHYYRGPGDEPYDGPDGLETQKEESPATAST